MGTVFLELAFATAAIYFACEYFTNGVEWLGRRLNLSNTAAGTLLAAFRTALPESIVTLIAVGFGSSPTQIGLLVLRSRAVGANASCIRSNSLDWLKRDQTWLLALFAAGALLGVVDLAWKSFFSVLFLLAYAFYVRREFNASGSPCATGVLNALPYAPGTPSRG